MIIERNLLIPRLTSLQDINYLLFGLIFEDIFGEDFKEMVSIKPKNKREEIYLMSKLLSFFSKQFYDSIPLDHIRGEDIVDKNVNSIHDLLEIISAFVKFIPKDFGDKQNNSLKFDAKGVQTSRSSNSSSVEELKDIDLCDISNRLRYESTSSSQSTESSPESSIRSLCPSTSVLRQKSINIENKEQRQTLLKQTDDKSIQTEQQMQTIPRISHRIVSPKDISFEEYKRLKCENFATLLGHRLHETLKLKQMTDIIEYKIKRYYGDVTTLTPKKINSKFSMKLRTNSNKKPSIRSKTTLNKKNITPLKSKSNDFKSLDDLIKAFPEIPRNTIKSIKDQENHQKRVIENLNKDLLLKESKLKSKLSEAIETQQKRSQIIRSDIKHLETLAETKTSKMSKLKEIAEKRDSRIERARIQKMLEKYQNDVKSKYKRLQSIEEKIVLNEYEKREKQQKDRIQDLRRNIREKQDLEMERQKKMLDTFETLSVFQTIL